MAGTGTGCVFCAVASGEAPGFVVAEEADVIAFLDTRPVFPGHTLVVPKAHLETLADLPATSLAGYFGFVQRVGNAVEAGLEADGTFVAINNKVSQSVPHLHTHVVPRRRKDGLRGFFWPRSKYPSDAFASETAAKIKSAMA
jgi:histidine triad (HIT) family protein